MSRDTANGQETQDRRLLPVTLLSGFSESGKSSILRHILRNKGPMRVAFIVNDSITERLLSWGALVH